jgi:hypothetical protein
MCSCCEVSGVSQVVRLPGLDELGEALRCSELAHAWALGAVTAAWLTLFSMLFHGYPIMLQRYYRLRREPLLKACRPPDTLF